MTVLPRQDTVMAVAADSDRDFLIPEHRRPAACPTRSDLAPYEPCLFFCMTILTHLTRHCNRKIEKNQKMLRFLAVLIFRRRILFLYFFDIIFSLMPHIALPMRQKSRTAFLKIALKCPDIKGAHGYFVGYFVKMHKIQASVFT